MKGPPRATQTTEQHGSSAFFNDITYLRPKVPTLYSALTTGSSAADPAIYGVNTHPYILKKGDVVEIILNNDDPGKHPFHLHGHNFQTVVRSEEEVGAYDATNITVPMPRTPMRRDTLLVRPNSNFAIRFRADNPDKRRPTPTPIPLTPSSHILTDRFFPACLYASGSSTVTSSGTWYQVSP